MIRSTLTAAALLAANAVSAAPVALSPGVIVMADEKAAFIADPQGFTQRISLDTGASSWLSGEKVYPLAVADGRLIGIGAPALPGSANLILLNPQSGALVDRVSIDLPESVTASLFALPNRRFGASLLDTSEGARIIWRYESSELRGAAVMETDQSGEEAINPITVMEGAFDLVRSGDRYYAVPVRAAFDAPSVPAVVLANNERVAGIDGMQFRAADDAHIMASQAQSDARFGHVYTWSLYTRDGQRKGEFKSPYSHVPFIVNGSQLLIRDQAVEYADANGDWVKLGTRLRAIDLASGTERWSVEVLDPEYRGPLPP